MNLQARIALVLQAIGADVKSLLSRSIPAGGSSGQALVKSSGTDYAVSWSTIISSLLAGYTSTIGTVAATDTIVGAVGKLNGNIGLKANIAATQVSIDTLTFATDSISGTLVSPRTANIAGSTTGAILGVVVLVIHNSGTAPTFDSKYKKLSGSGSYVTGSINYIYCQYINTTAILYSINQAT